MNLKKWPVAVGAAIVVALIGAACVSKSNASAISAATNELRSQ